MKTKEIILLFIFFLPLIAMAEYNGHQIKFVIELTDGNPIGYSTITYGNVYYKWEVTKNDITNTYFDTVFYPAGEYKTFQIDY